MVVPISILAGVARRLRPICRQLANFCPSTDVALLLIGERKNEQFYRNSTAKRREQIKQWKATIALERKLFLMGYYKAFGLPAETCALCKKCSYPGRCKFPNEKRPSIEACSIDVFETIKKLGKSARIVHDTKETYNSYSLILLL